MNCFQVYILYLRAIYSSVMANQAITESNFQFAESH